eukprot:TRINITY_DN40743_c0_g1_i1.p1 TRINITY_DN40743_c0_g1~~TRINITY_DN40743_c0_g1_i1.p1  ORF type:complete len:308 (-),score=80.68 TRINITY_DN40743_c0_g1_i1:198-1121(-)
MADHELDSQMRARGVPMDQRKRILAAAKLGVPNPLAQLGLASARPPPSVAPAAQTVSRSVSPGAKSPGVPAIVDTKLASTPVDTTRNASSRSALRALRATNEEEQDLDGFLAGGRKATAAMAKQKAAEFARRELVAREQATRDRQQAVEREAMANAERDKLHRERAAQRAKDLEEREKEEEEERRAERRRQRREDKMRKREEKRRQREEVADADLSEDEPERDDSDDNERQSISRRGFFSQAYKGNQEARRIWSEPIKGQVSNNYKGFSDADLDRRFGTSGVQSGGTGSQKLMTEEEVLAILRKGKK